MSPESIDTTDAPRHRSGTPKLRIRRITAFAIAFGLTLLVALEGGGYDVAFREQLGLLLWAGIGIAFAFGGLPRGRPPHLVALPLIAFAVLAALTALALIWTDSDELTYEELTRVIGYSAFVVLAYAGLNRHTWKAAAAGLAVAALVVPVLALYSRLSPGTLTDETANLFGLDRLGYPLGYWNALACWCAMAIAIALAWSGHARRLEVRAALLAAVPVAATTAFLTYSRAGIIAAGVAVLAAIVLSRNRWTVGFHAGAAALGAAAAIGVAHGQHDIARAEGSDGAGAVVLVLLAAAGVCAAAAFLAKQGGTDDIRLPRRTARAVVPVGVALVLVLGAAAGGSRIGDAWDEFKNEGSPTTESGDPASRLGSFGGDRYKIWTSALDAYDTQSARGIGPGAFEFWWSRHGDGTSFVRDAHSLYFESMAELGIGGLLAVVTVLFGIGWVGFRSRYYLTRPSDIGPAAALSAAFVVLLVYFGVDWAWEVPALVLLGLGGMAVVGAADFPRLGEAPVSAPLRWGAVAAALALAATQVPSLVSVERVRASAHELQAGSPERAAELAQDAIDATPWAASAYVQRGLVEESDGDYGAAEDDYTEAVRREPENWRHHLLLARLDARRGDEEAMQEQLDETARLAPDSPFLRLGSPFQNQLKALLAAAPAEQPQPQKPPPKQPKKPKKQGGKAKQPAK